MSLDMINAFQVHPRRYSKEAHEHLASTVCAKCSGNVLQGLDWVDCSIWLALNTKVLPWPENSRKWAGEGYEGKVNQAGCKPLHKAGVVMRYSECPHLGDIEFAFSHDDVAVMSSKL